MTLISEGYRDLQRELHSRSCYGIGANAQQCAEAVRDIMPAGSSILDYGCGQGRLKDFLEAAYDVREYDPAIAGKDTPPEPADCVVCSDVLEHIEPELLDNVLADIRRLTKGRAVFAISTVPAGKALADGRNAHLIIETHSWWRQRLSDHFAIMQGKILASLVFIVAKPLILIGEINAQPAIGEEGCFANVKINVTKTDRRLSEVDFTHDGPAIIACYGPSLKETWPMIRDEMKAGGHLVTVSGAHDFLLKNKLQPLYHIECDARFHKAEMVTPHWRTEYLLGSCVHPSLVDKTLAVGATTTLWHVNTGLASIEHLAELEPEEVMVSGGGSVGMRAMSVMWLLGYRKFLIHGMDCSFTDDQHAGPHTGKGMKEIQVRCGARWYRTSLVLVTYARHFLETLSLFPPGLEIEMHGDGLLQQMCRIGMSNTEVISNGTADTNRVPLQRL